MCYEAIIDGEAGERSWRELIRGEMQSAVTVGGVAALVVLVVLAGRAGPGLAAGAAVCALALGVGLHQSVFLAGVALVRWRGPSDGRVRDTA